MFRTRNTGRLLFLVLPLILLFLSACAAKLTPNLSHQGRLLDENGSPVADGNYDVEYKIYQVVTGGTAVYTETSTVAVKDGLFTNSLGLTSTIDPTIFAQPTWLEVTVNGETLTPRQRLQGSPFAFSLVSGAAVQGAQPLARTFAGQENTGAALTVLNNDGTATGGHGLLAINRAAAAGVARADVAAFQARALGGVVADGTGSYGAIITSQAFRGMYVKANDVYYAALFDSPVGIALTGGGGCTGCALTYNAMNVGDGPIAAGDFVAVVGVELDAELNIPVIQVRKATSASDAVIGVAVGAAVRDAVGEHNGVTTGGFEGANGPAAAGGYLSVVVQGLVQARAADAGLQPGASINAGVDGAVAAANGFTRALSAVDGNGMVWVMLSGQ
jgi:hypothetical protein